MPLTEAEELELLELEEEEYQHQQSLASKETSQEIKPEYSQGESFGAGGAQGMSLGFFDELYGAAKSVPTAIDTVVGDKTFDDVKNTYSRERDFARGAFGEAEEQNPASFTGGEIFGATATTAVPGLGAGKLASAARSGGLYGAGASEGETVGEIGRDALIGAVAAPVLEFGGNKLVQAAGKYVPKALRSGAEGLANMAGGAGKYSKPGTGAALLDEGVVRPLSTKTGVQNRAQAAVNSAGKQIDEALEKIPAKVGRKSAILDQLDERIAELSSLPGAEGQVRVLKGIRKRFTDEPNLKRYTAKELEEVKRRYAKKGNYGKQKKSDSAQGFEDAAAILREKTEDMATEAGSEIHGQFLKGKQTFGDLKPVAEPHSTGFRDAIIDAGLLLGGEAYGGASGEHGTGIGLAALRRYGKVPALSTGAVGMNTASKVASEVAKRVGGAIPGAARTAVGRLTEGEDEVDVSGSEKENTPIQDQRLDTPALTKSIARRQLDALSGTPYAEKLLQAAERGGDSVKTTHFLLSQEDPEYQRLLKEADESR